MIAPPRLSEEQTPASGFQTAVYGATSVDLDRRDELHALAELREELLGRARHTPLVPHNERWSFYFVLTELVHDLSFATATRWAATLAASGLLGFGPLAPAVSPHGTSAGRAAQ